MIKKISDFFRMTVVSPEFLAILICLVVNIYWPSIYVRIDNWLSESDKWIYLLGVLGCALGFSVLLAKEILFPSSESNNKILINWPNYPLLKCRIYFSICISFIGTVAVFILWVAKNILSANLVGLVFVICISVVFASLATLVFASLSIRALIEGNS